MRQQQTWYEVVQVVSRAPDGGLREWYPGDEKFGTYMAAKHEAKRLAVEFPTAQYQVIETRLVEVGKQHFGRGV